MKFKTQDQVTLDYTDQGTGQPVVILTGLGGVKEIWRQQISALLTAGYRVINFDCRNQGQSEHTAKGRRISRHAQDLAELMAALQLEQVILLGNSMGAATIFAYVSLYGTQHVVKIIDVDQSLQMVNTAEWVYGFKQLTWTNFYSYIKQPLGRSTFKHIDDETYRQIRPIQQKYPYDATLNLPFLVDHATQNWCDVIAGLQCPILFVAGEQSPYFDSAFASMAATLAPLGQATVIANSGHIVMAEQPVAFNQALLTFLAQ
ncbi:alpha/beta fold hydrolase [Loigolactobacillus zhaoyuanensis]|uniref:Alpha/beta fold hydrolase n=1 Tax=Loigolactobacillus zhaoyuanensis TaxID=2486017 RepID=A0ABW8UFY4_9LACO|nr:alpha/beta hydrolase [Loigolactobacillus zhaoyuanensis]